MSQSVFIRKTIFDIYMTYFNRNQEWKKFNIVGLWSTPGQCAKSGFPKRTKTKNTTNGMCFSV